jgi:acetylornithine deacetylase/succinyl-diaminopimelate desuccinylase-like protein
MAAAGHAENALPQTATANVNCRMLPNENPDSVVATIRRVINDSAVKVSLTQPAILSPASPLVPEVMQPVERLTARYWPGAAVVPEMETGATDGLYFRNAGMPVYGVSGVAIDRDEHTSHGRDEHIRVAAFYTGVDFTYDLVKLLTS